MFCQNCGKENQDEGGSKFCENCGGMFHISPQTNRLVPDNPINNNLKITVKPPRANLSRLIRTFIIIFVVFIIPISIFSAYFTYFVPSPADVVVKLYKTVDNADINTMLSCTDPLTEMRYKSGMKLGGALFGAVTGVNFDLSDVLNVMPGLAEEISGKKVTTPKYNISNVNVISIKGKTLDDFVDKYGNKILCIGNSLGDEAVVEYTINDPKNDFVDRHTFRVKIIKYGDSGWRMPGDAQPVLVK